MAKNSLFFKLAGLMILVGVIYAALLEGANRLKVLGPGYHIAGVIGAVLLFILMFILLARWLMKGQGPSAADILAKGGKEAKAKILGIHDTGMMINNLYYLIKLDLEVQPEGGTNFPTQVSGLFSRVKLPRVGDMVTVAYNPNNKAQIAVKTE